MAIIPARANSKSIPNKNIKLLNEYPLIAYSIEAALQSKYIDRVIVSTDSKKIEQVALTYGAEVPVLRPTELAQDDTPDFPVLKHMVYWLEKNESYKADIIVFLRPTSPLRPKALVDDTIETLINNKEADSIRAVLPSHSAYRMWKCDDNKYLQPLLKLNINDQFNSPRQKLPKTFWQTGHIEVIRAQTVKEKDSITGEKILPYYMDAKFAIDVDSESDWELAAWWIKLLNNKIVIPQKN